MHTLIKKIYINENLFKVYFDKKDLKFTPGQHFSLSIPGMSVNREYSSYSSMNESEIGFLIRRVEGGIMTNILDKLSLGSKINIYGPYGSFVLNDETKQLNKIIFIATGTGIAPFVSIVNSYNLKNYQLYLGVRLKKDIPDYDLFDEEKCFYSISRESNIGKSNNFFKGRINDQIKKIDMIDNYKSFKYMICGNSSMISDVYDILVNEKKINPNNINMESFF